MFELGSCAKSLLRIVGFLLAFGAFPPAVSAQQPWDGPAFSGRPAEIAAAVPDLVSASEPAVIVLLDETQIVLDASDRAVETNRVIYRIGTAPPADWSIIGAVWQPWRQQRPVVRARVITPDGRVVQFDEKALAETPLHVDSPDTFADSRVLRAPLPALSAGAIVEVQTVVRDTQPLFNRGVVRRVPFGKVVPVLRSVLTIDAPSTLPLRHSMRLLPNVAPSVTTSGRNTRLRFESGRLEALDPADLVFESAENPKQPYVAFSTASSWRDVAGGYAAIVDGRIAESNAAAIAKEVIGDATDRNQIIDRVLEKVQRGIRYAAVELGSGSIIPRSPGETLKLEYGDCKDQAAVMISLLRSAGVEAYMALLSAGPGPDVEPDLPGFGAFDHAIVYIPGPEPLWIDSTVRFSRAGQLPVQDQGRLALIVKPDTTALVQTPDLPSGSSETHEVFLAEDGPGRIVVTRDFSGTRELTVRVEQSELQPAQLEEALKEHARIFYAAKDVRSVERSDPADFSRPFRIRFEVTDAGFAQTTGGESAFFIFPFSTIAEGPLALVTLIDDKRLSAGLDFGEAFVREWKYRVIPPPGYRKLARPANSTSSLGPATVTRTFAEEIDGTITASIRLDSGKRRYSGQDLAALKKEIEELDEDSFIEVKFEQTAQAYLEEGKGREALKEFRALAELHPDEAVHHVQLAHALLRLGMGESAREEARKAVQLEPSSAQAHAALGFILEHDVMGRPWRPGFDLQQARAAYEKALELASDDATIRAEYAILLEYDAAGVRYAPGVDLTSAIEQYRKVEDELEKSTQYRRNLPYVLLRTGKYEELKGSSVPADIRLAAIAASDGVAASMREAGRLDAAQRSSLLEAAGSLLIQMRLYEPAAALIRAAANSTNPRAALTRASQVERMRRHEELLTDTKDPTTVARQFFVKAFLGGRGEELSPLLTKAGREELRQTPDLKPLIASQPLASLAGTGELSLAANADAALSMMSPGADGDDSTGYRIDLAGPMVSLGPRRTLTHLFVVMEDGEYRVLTAGPNEFALAKGALRFLEGGDVVTARKWLDWAEEEVDLARIDGETLNISAFFAVWFNSPTKNLPRMRQAAAALLSSSPEAASTALPILQEGRQATTGRVRLGLNLAYGTALLTLGRHEEALAVGREVMRADPQSRGIFLVAECLFRLGRIAELESLLEQELPKSGDVRDVTLLLAAVELHQGNAAQSEGRLRDLASSGRQRGEDTRTLGWLRVYADQISESDIAANFGGNSPPPLFDSLGCVLLPSSMPRPAKQRTRSRHLHDRST